MEQQGRAPADPGTRDDGTRAAGDPAAGGPAARARDAARRGAARARDRYDARDEAVRRRLGVRQEGHLARAVPPEVEDEARRQAGRPSDRVLTIPNALSVLRILLVPVFAWLLLGPGEPGWALGVLVASTVTDWLDGKIARAFDMGSRIGEYLDPMADRLLIIVAPVTFVLAGMLPWWIAAVLVARDVALAPTLLAYRARGVRPRVMYLGKAATFALMWAIPLYLASVAGWSFSPLFAPWASALLIWGAALYVWTGVLYVWRAVRTWRR
ncbi:CDP-alcohol phosphatidyltransferase family protein [Corynebacterium sp. 335C]